MPTASRKILHRYDDITNTSPPPVANDVGNMSNIGAVSGNGNMRQQAGMDRPAEMDDMGHAVFNVNGNFKMDCPTGGPNGQAKPLQKESKVMTMRDISPNLDRELTVLVYKRVTEVMLGID